MDQNKDEMWGTFDDERLKFYVSNVVVVFEEIKRNNCRLLAAVSFSGIQYFFKFTRFGAIT